MRTLKFRAFCEVDTDKGTSLNRMVYFDPVNCDNGIFMDAPEDVQHINEYHSELMQFTGLLDKNGKEIYEGDVLHCSKVNYKLKRHISGAYELYAIIGDGKYSCQPYFLFKEADKIEVIGNIHEDNPLFNS